MSRNFLPEIDPAHVFSGQQPDERVVALVRKHWFFGLRQLVVFLALAVAPAIFLLILAVRGLDLPSWRSQGWLLFIYLWYLLCLMLGTYVLWLKDHIDVLVVTNERIILTNQIGMFNMRRSEASIGAIQDLSFTTTGFLSSVLHYGRLTIQTSSEQADFMIERVAEPMAVRDKILQIRDEHLSHGNAEALKEVLHTPKP